MTNDAAQSSPTLASFSGSPRQSGYEAWREEICRRFVRVDAKPTAREWIHCEVALAQVSNLALATASGSSACFERSRRLLSDQCDDFVLIVTGSGPVEVTFAGKSVELQPAEMFLSNMTIECSASLHGGNAFTAARIPRRDLLTICPHAEDRMGVPLVGAPAIRQAIAAYLALAAKQGQLFDPVGQQLLARHAIDMVALLLRTDPDRSELAHQRGYSAARLELVQHHIINNIADPNLTIAAVALRQRCHPKQVQRLFARTGSTFAEFVLDQRLQNAQRLLSCPSSRAKKISEIAYDVGFRDLAYFNRTFRSRFGMTPSDCRSTARTSDGAGAVASVVRRRIKASAPESYASVLPVLANVLTVQDPLQRPN